MPLFGEGGILGGGFGQGQARQGFQDYRQNRGEWLQQAPFLSQNRTPWQGFAPWFQGFRGWQQARPRIWQPNGYRPQGQVQGVTPRPGPVAYPTDSRGYEAAAIDPGERTRREQSSVNQMERQAGGRPIREQTANRRAARQFHRGS